MLPDDAPSPVLLSPKGLTMAPFDSAAASVSIQASPVTIALLRQRVKTDLTLGERRKRELLSALNSYAKYLNINPEHGDATFAANRTKIERFAPAIADIGQRRWSNILSHMTLTFRPYGVAGRLRPLPANLRPQWRGLCLTPPHYLSLFPGP